ncbi:MAG: hypothetical protein RIT28_4105, partial [Pseudomonadota bacterium]
MLTTREEALLRRLLQDAGQLVSVEQLLVDVWGRRWQGEPTELGVVRNAIFKLRQKLELDTDTPDHLLTVQNAGYRLVLAVEPQVEVTAAPPPPVVLSQTMPPPGGPWSAAWDVGRRAELQRAQQVLDTSNIPVLLVGAWRMGKTWTLRGLLSRLRAGDAVVRIHPRSAPPEALSNPERLVEWVALLLAEATRLPEAEAMRALQGPGPPVWRLHRWLDRALGNTPGRLIIAIEDLDLLGRQSIFPSFMAMLRGWAEEDRAGGERLRLLITSATPPAGLEELGTSMPFVLCHTVPLGALRPQDVQELARRVGRSSCELEALLTETGGSPYLLRLVLSFALARGEPCEAVLSEALLPAALDLQMALSATPKLSAGLG